jgi:hypothetical protein
MDHVLEVLDTNFKTKIIMLSLILWPHCSVVLSWQTKTESLNREVIAGLVPLNVLTNKSSLEVCGESNKASLSSDTWI